MSEPVTGRVLLTGATGFVGRYVRYALEHRGRPLRLMLRNPLPAVEHVLADLEETQSFGDAFAGVDTVIHCAGYAHAFGEPDAAVARRHARINHEATVALAQAAAQAGVRRFVFCSSVKAVADTGTQCVDESFEDWPQDAYGLAKRRAEEDLLQLAQASALEVVILRPSMVYGPGSRGNLERMLRLVRAGRFPPLPETGNRRSLIFIDDLVEAILLAADHPAAAGRRFIVACPEAPSGRVLYLALCEALGRSPSAWCVPEAVLRTGARAGDMVETLLRRRMPFNTQVVSRLLDSACYRSDALQQALGWQARVSLRAGLARLIADEE